MTTKRTTRSSSETIKIRAKKEEGYSKALNNNNHYSASATTITSSSNAITKYVRNINTMSKSTAYEYFLRLNNFERFLLTHYDNKSADNIIKEINEEVLDPYDILSEYCAYLKNHSSNISLPTIKQRVVTAKNFLEYYDVDISPRKFKLKVKLPKSIRRNREAVSKEDIVNILNACSDIRLKTYVMLLASTGCRATEALSTRLCDYDLDSKPARVFIRGEYTKTKVDRRIFLTDEMVSQLISWLEYKYRKRRVCYKDGKTGKTITEYRKPQKNPNDLVFVAYSKYNNNNTSNLIEHIYNEMVVYFGKTLDRMGRGDREANGRRRQITLHTLRRWVKSTISDLGYADFSEFMIGHAGSTYWQKKDSEKAELFRKVESSLTFIDIPSLERKGADFQSKIDVLEQENFALRQRDSMNTDSIAILSDQLTKVMQEIQILKKQI
jgi:integrase